jgi:NADPH:quinone reductase-like Zn-dependent oxidoreductase
MAYGAWSELLAIRACDLWRAPIGPPPEQLALVRINLSTAYLLLQAYTRLTPGDWIVQNAANSNVAHYVAQLAAMGGLHVIDIVRRPELVARLEAAGRRHVLVDDADIAAKVARIAGGRPRVALDAIGGTATTRLGTIVADDGMVLAYGFLAEQPYALAYPDVMFRNVQLQGMMTDRAMDRIGPEGRETMTTTLQSVMASDVLAAEIAGVYAFEDISAALRHAAGIGGTRAGKVILVPHKP